MSKDILYIDEFEVRCRIGITAEERSKPQPLLISIRILCDTQPAALSDLLSDTVDYAALVEDIRTVVKLREFNLMETVAEAVASLITSKYRAESTEVKIEKKIFPGIKGAGVIIRRPQ